jgi:hypothetical protein
MPYIGQYEHSAPFKENGDFSEKGSNDFDEISLTFGDHFYIGSKVKKGNVISVLKQYAMNTHGGMEI